MGGLSRSRGVSPRDVYESVIRFGTIAAAARELGIPRETASYKYNKHCQETGAAEAPMVEAIKSSQAGARDRGQQRPHPRVVFPELPSEQLPTDELIHRMVSGFERRVVANQARIWMPILLEFTAPVALVFFGDPHLDDNGCNWPLLLRDVELVKKTPGVYGVGMGDYTNNWSGRLAQKIYPYQEATRPQAWQLAEWFFKELLDKWLLLIKGNHDIWSLSFGNGDPLDWIYRGAAPLEEWQARIELRFKNDRGVKIWASHDFPGRSIYNPLHSNMRAAKFSSGEADIYVSGDKHNWSLFQNEDPEKNGKVYWAARARGYKYIDSHADRLGYKSQQHGASIAAVIDPTDESASAIQMFADVEKAVKFVTLLRKDYGAD